jgi:hypothetical protein
MTEHTAAVLARHLAARAVEVCRHYLSNGRRSGRYWLAGDVQNSKGRSLYVRLEGPLAGPGAAGKWTEHVAARVMLRMRDLALPCGRSPGSTQHNVSAWRGIL